MKLEKCPNCGYGPVSGQTLCPKCGFSLKETTTDDDMIIEKNDDIQWQELKDLPIGSVAKMFDEEEAKAAPKPEVEIEASPKTETSPEAKVSTVPTTEAEAESTQNALPGEEVNPILAQYIRAHKDDYEPESLPPILENAAEELKDTTPASAETAISKKPAEEKIQPPAEEKETAKTETAALEKKHTPQPEAAELLLSSADKAAESLEEATAADSVAEEVNQKEPSEPVVDDPQKAEEVAVIPVKDAAAESLADSAAAASPRAEAAETGEGLIHVDLTATKSEASIAAEAKEDTPPAAESLPEAEETRAVPRSGSADQPPKKKKRKFLLAAVCAVIVAGSGGYYWYHEEQVKAEEKQQAEIKATAKKVAALQTELESFYTDSEHHFIKADKADTDLTKLKQEINHYKEADGYQKLVSVYEDLTTKLGILSQVNLLFTEKAISGSELAQDLKLKTAAKPQVTIDSTDETFVALADKAVAQAQAQYEALTAAKEAVSGLLTEGKVRSDLTREQYAKAKAAVVAISNQDLVTAETASLKLADEALTAKEKAAAEKAAKEKAAAEKAAAEKAAAEKAAAAAAANKAAANSSSTDPNPKNQPIMATNQTDIADSTNAAWTWAAGVKEKVLATCFERGYIVEGGYRLEKVQIKDGQGYYNLFATSNQSPFLQGFSEKSLPVYLVTINCKTGWFKGNGNDQTIGD